VLQLAYEWGVPFALLVIAVTPRARCGGSSALPGGNRLLTDPTRLVLWMCIVGALIEAQLDGLLSAPHSQLMFTVLVRVA
jgi:hypothetical protein